ncbi:MAG: cobalamin biosynthesis protein [Xanthomonadales bacterium]|nr:cobalamin biosynthesis protein [Xanthomonadales bacterium]
MTIIAILLAFALSHFVRELGQLRKHQWLGQWIHKADDWFGKLPAWNDYTGFAIILFVPLIALTLLNQLFMGLFGNIGVFLLGVAGLVYCFGQRDLDTQVADIIQSSDENVCEQRLGELLQRDPPDDSGECLTLTVNAVFSESLRRWFAVIFWFAVLGIIGAFLYRIVDWLSTEKSGLSSAQKGYFIRTRHVLDWPAAQLMTLSLAIATDFDSVFIAWKKYHDEQGHGLFEGSNGFLLTAAQQIVLSGHVMNDGYADQLDGPKASLRQSMDLVWRVLGVWMTALALLLLIDVIT